MVIHFNLNILCVNLSVKGLCFYFFLTTTCLKIIQLFNFNTSKLLSKSSVE